MTRNPNTMMRRFSSSALALAALLAVPAALTGCGGVNGSSPAARIRVADAATNAATADVIVNSASAYGDLQNGGVSPYLYIGVSSSSFTYTTTTPLPTNSIPLTTNNVTLADGQFYTAFLIGRPDVSPPGGIGVNPLFARVVVANDSKPALASGQAAVRVVSAAPDIGTVVVSGIGAAPLSVSYLTVTAYQAVTAGTLSVSAANPACTASVGCGAGGVFVPATPVTVQAGQAYTLIVTEPTAPTGTPVTGAYTYKLLTLND